MTADIVESAKAFATLCHANQMHGSRPYIEHCERVVKILVEHGYTDADLLAAAWLHDVIEDCGVTHVALLRRFGPRITDLAWACTGEGVNRQARYEDIARKLHEIPAAIPIKVADRIDNVRACHLNSDPRLKMYRDEYPAFRRVVSALHDPERDRLLMRLDLLMDFA